MKKSNIKCIHSFSSTFLVLYSLLAFLLVSLFNFSFSNIVYICLHTFLYILLLMTTNNSLLSALLSFITLCILLLIHYNVTRLSLPSISHPLVHISSLLSILTLFLSATYLLSIPWLLPSLFPLLL